MKTRQCGEDGHTERTVTGRPAGWHLSKKAKDGSMWLSGKGEAGEPRHRTVETMTSHSQHEAGSGLLVTQRSLTKPSAWPGSPPPRSWLLSPEHHPTAVSPSVKFPDPFCSGASSQSVTTPLPGAQVGALPPSSVPPCFGGL